jgi:hypothetical protein
VGIAVVIVCLSPLPLKIAGHGNNKQDDDNNSSERLQRTLFVY